MKRAVFWSKSALDDLKQQMEFIAADNPMSARHVAEALDIAAKGLGEKSTGRRGRVSGTWEKSVARLPYVIAYALEDDAVTQRLIILRVIHTARDWAAESWPR